MKFDELDQRMRVALAGPANRAGRVAGEHEIIWDGRNDSGAPVSSGVYFYSFSVDGIHKGLQRMTLVK